MQSLQLQNESHRVLYQKFSDWLDVLGYAPSTLYLMPIHVKEFLYYLEQHGKHAGKVTKSDIDDYYSYLKQRPGKFGALSAGSINKHLQALKLFSKFMRKMGKVHYPISLRTERATGKASINVATKAEIQALFAATEHSSERDCLKLRDKAILVLCYSCGLRRNEVVHVNVSDVYFDKERLLVRQGKNYKERFVPLNGYNLRILEDYLFDGRPQVAKQIKTEALLVSQMGERLQGGGMTARLNVLCNMIGVKDGQNGWQGKRITLHTLRHSIATHLLQQGMPMEQIRQFLGHSSLESTQIYTHLLKDLGNDI